MAARAGIVIWLGLAAFLAGCEAGPHQREGTGPERRDSAGIAVVTLNVQRLEALPVIDADTVPALSLGPELEAADAELGWVRAAARRSDGSIIIADANGTVLRAFATDGSYLGSAGRMGTGPGEYTQIATIAVLPGDSIVVFDLGANSRASILDPQLRFIRALGLDLPHGPRGAAEPGPYGLGSLDAVFLGGGDPIPQREGGAGPTGLVHHDTLALVLLRGGPTSFTVDTLRRVPGAAWQIQQFSLGRSTAAVFFGGRPFIAGNASGFVVAHGSSFEVSQFDPDGRLQRIIRVAAPARTITAEERQAAEEEFRQRRPPLVPFEMRLETEEEAHPKPVFAEHHPFINGLRLDAAGNIWIEPDPELACGRGRLVLAPDGEPRAWLRGLPQRILHLGHDHLLALEPGPDDATRLLEYRIRLP